MFRDARNKAGLSREGAAFRLHIGTRTLNNYENGVTVTTPDVVLKMTEVCKQPTLKELKDVKAVRDDLVDISEDGVIEDHEKPVLEEALRELLELEKAIETLKLWAAQLLPIDRLVQEMKENAALKAAQYLKPIIPQPVVFRQERVNQMPEIMDKISELRELFRQRFGVEVTVEIAAFPSYNEHLTPELANYIANELAARMKPEEIQDYQNSQSGDGNHRWVRLLNKNGFEFVAHY